MKRILNVISIVALGLALIIPAIYFFQLPETIPIHFDINGKPNKYGSRISIFFIPIISLILFFSIGYCNVLLKRKTQLFDFPEKYDEEQTQLALKFSIILRAVILCLLAYLTWASIQVSLGNWTSLGGIMMYGFAGTIVIVVAIYLIKYYRTL